MWLWRLCKSCLVIKKITMLFFDFIFYRTYKQYIKWGELDIPDGYALCVITLFPCLNISSLLFFGINFFRVKSWDYNVWTILLFFLLVMFLNYQRVYKKIGLQNLIKRWDEVDNRKKRQYRVWMLLYLILSMIVLFVSIVNWIGY